MKIDWKHVSKTPGYLSLKAAYIHDVRESVEYERKFGHAMRGKPVFIKLFNWVICRAKHYAQHKNVTIDVVLDGWESKRNYWWLNFYQPCNQPKYHSSSKKSMGVKGVRKDYKTGLFSRYNKPGDVKHRVCAFIVREQKNRSTRTKARWPDWRRK